MKEKRVRDGKKDRGWGTSRVSAAADARSAVVVSRTQRETKEGRYAVRRGSVSYAVFDPEECLHVGRHDGAVGIVYRFRRLVWKPGQDRRDYSPSGERGLVPWDGGGWRSLAMAAAEFALSRSCAGRPPRSVVEAMAAPGAWGRLEFWKDMADRHALAKKVVVVKEVMES